MKKLIFTLFLISGGILLAQDTNTAPVLHPIDENIKGLFDKFSYFQFLLLPILTALALLVKKYIPRIPDVAFPYLLPVIGAIFDYLAIQMNLWQGNAAAGAVFGGLSVWVHQLFKQTVEAKEKSISKSIDVVSNLENSTTVTRPDSITKVTVNQDNVNVKTTQTVPTLVSNEKSSNTNDLDPNRSPTQDSLDTENSNIPKP